MTEDPKIDSVTFTFLLGGRSVCGQEHRPERCEDCSEMANCVLDVFYQALHKSPSATDKQVVSSPIKHMLDAIKVVQDMKEGSMSAVRKSDSSIYLIGESAIDAGANAISNIFKMGGLNEDQTTELNIALEQFKIASNSPIPCPAVSPKTNPDCDDDEPDLKPVSNCLKKHIVITPEICTKFWIYRADSGHLAHLLIDLVGEEFFTTHRQDECIEKVLNEWETPEKREEREGNQNNLFDKVSHPWIHHVKCWPYYFDLMLQGKKPWDKRVWDRDYAPGDIIVQEEWSQEHGYSGRSLSFIIGYILDGEFAKPGECLMTMESVCERQSCKKCPKEHKCSEKIKTLFETAKKEEREQIIKNQKKWISKRTNSPLDKITKFDLFEYLNKILREGEQQ